MIKRLFENSILSQKEAFYLIVLFCIRFNLSSKAKCELIKLLHLFIPSPNSLPKNMESIEKIIVKNSLDVIKEYKFCNKCQQMLHNAICTNIQCVEFENVATHFDSFHAVGIANQLKNIISKNYTSICKFLHDKDRSFIDIIDGNQYKFENGTLNLLTFTDGVQIYKSTAKQSCVWPVICNIIELPQSIRESKRNKIISGIWTGQNKPNSDILFKHLIEDISQILSNGLIIDIRDKPTKFFIKLYGFLGDVPAKALIMNHIQFNGYFGCPYCFIKVFVFILLYSKQLIYKFKKKK